MVGEGEQFQYDGNVQEYVVYYWYQFLVCQFVVDQIVYGDVCIEEQQYLVFFVGVEVGYVQQDVGDVGDYVEYVD